MAARIPFDDRVNHQAWIDDFDLGLIQAYLQEIKSELYRESTRMSLAELSRAMLIAKGPEEDLRPVNVGLLFYPANRKNSFPAPGIELVWHQDGSGKKFKEYYFKGPLHKHLRDALSFLNTNIIGEQVAKRPDKAEADRFFNFPYDAVEEALSNAVYHKSYEVHSPIEVQVWPDKIEILSYPGPVPPVNANKLKSDRRIVAREYRNRRIGDFLKELHLTEGRGTGFPTIYDAMEANGSPKPVFETDDDCTYFLVTLPAHELAAGNQVTNGDKNLVFNGLEDVIAFANQATNQATNQAANQAANQAEAIINEEVHERVAEILNALANWKKRAEMFEQVGLSNQSFNREKYLDPLIELGWVTMEFPEKRTSPYQRYRITATGKNVLNLLKGK
ncbi:MAG: ATP-binding protein [Owenweeksia sp.]|nr:ATP-binding protein [Owenweeksia sp.]